MNYLRRHFERLGFKADFERLEEVRRVSGRVDPPYRVTVTTDKKKREKFLIGLREGVEAIVLDVKPEARAMLIMIKDRDASHKNRKLAKMLVGHDERQLFVAVASSDSSTVYGAMESLKPPAITEAERRSGVKRKKRHSRKNAARIRQGDFFFLPAPGLVVHEELVLTNEPINRGRGASHMVEFLYRTGGELVWANRLDDRVLSNYEYETLMRRYPDEIYCSWRSRKRNAAVYAKGRVTHREHATIVLNGWHRVLPNNESGHPGFGDMSFID